MQLQGIVVSFLGDSITEGHGVDDRPNNRFDNRLAAKYGLIPRNYGIGGTRIAHQRRASEKARYDLCFCGRAFDLDRNSKLVVVYGGTNDYGHGDAPFGTDEDNTPDTYCGAIEYLINTLQTEYPGIKIVFLTPARRLGDEKAITDRGGEDNRPLIEYVDAILRIAEKHGLSVLDLYRDLGIDPNGEDDRTRYTSDGLHLNDAGHGVLAEKLGKFLTALPE